MPHSPSHPSPAPPTLTGMTPTPVDAALIVGTTARLTRLITTDDLGVWWVQQPVSNALASWEHRHERDHPARKYAEGLTCPHCVSFHAAWIVTGAYALMSRNPRTLVVWRFGAAALSVSAVVGHVNARLG